MTSNKETDTRLCSRFDFFLEKKCIWFYIIYFTKPCYYYKIAMNIFQWWACMCRIHTQESALNSKVHSRAVLSNRSFCSDGKVPYLCSAIWQPLTHYLAVSLTKDGEVMHTENHKILLKERKSILPTKIKYFQSI